MTAEISKDMERELDACFEALRAAREEPSPELLARVLADGYAEQDARTAVAPAAPAPRRGWLRNLIDMIGGWPALAGLATATLAGVWIGYNPPAAFDSLTLALLNESYGYDVGLSASILDLDEVQADG
ncbi:hypothetical protein [Tropicimonas sp. IMCC6043]|uniref:hypothetical protein n=1 Tax=Tropicimonas sp. IMCC6043 TaxID=2510645 RepID=UPI00101C5C9E|nr:hypothetical protein [Tropicimonas sp. IMCC6043]RYH11631.1 hypothetical protein EU800_03045 [Tropicimonas sp. IMCC6043]